MNREELKLACLGMLDRVALEHPAGHQGKYAARYVLRSASSTRIGLMFEKGEKSKPYLWVERRFAYGLLEAGIEFKIYLASSLYPATERDRKAAYGRHAALKAMRDLANADLVRFTVERITQLEMILAELTTA